MTRTSGIGGMLTVTVFNGQNLKSSVNPLHNVEAYCVLYAGQKGKTDSKNSKNPEWKQPLFPFKVEETDILYIECFDKQSFGYDVLIGSADIGLSDICKGICKEKIVPLTAGDKENGKIKLNFDFK